MPFLPPSFLRRCRSARWRNLSSFSRVAWLVEKWFVSVRLDTTFSTRQHRRKLVISTEADRRLFFHLRSAKVSVCGGVGLRSGEISLRSLAQPDGFPTPEFLAAPSILQSNKAE